MSASPIGTAQTLSRRRPLIVTQRRIAANRRNATRSTGPRTPEGKARVARNPITHGFFVGKERWAPTQRQDFEETLRGLRDGLQPSGPVEEGCVATIAESYVRMAAMFRYESIAALKHHENCERALDQRIAAADPAEAELLRRRRDELRLAGLWRPTIPGPREAMAIARYSGSLERTIHSASSDLQGLRAIRLGGASRATKVQKQTHFEASPRSGPEAAEGPRTPPLMGIKTQKQTHYSAPTSNALGLGEGPQVAPSVTTDNAKANPLSSMFTGNRHERRRAKALALRKR